MNKKTDMLETVEVITENFKSVKQTTIADKIWQEIKNKPLEMFALPKQFVNMYCSPVIVEPTKLYLLSTVPATLPALEVALKDLYFVEKIDRYICVSNIVNKD